MRAATITPAPDVPCEGCGKPISAARASLRVAHGRCVDCNRGNLHSACDSNAPEYGTAVAERKNADSAGWTARVRD